MLEDYFEEEEEEEEQQQASAEVAINIGQRNQPTALPCVLLTGQRKGTVRQM